MSFDKDNKNLNDDTKWTVYDAHLERLKRRWGNLADDIKQISLLKILLRERSGMFAENPLAMATAIAHNTFCDEIRKQDRDLNPPLDLHSVWGRGDKNRGLEISLAELKEIEKKVLNSKERDILARYHDASDETVPLSVRREELAQALGQDIKQLRHYISELKKRIESEYKRRRQKSGEKA